ncbi:MAG TPA: GNAT family N-acetyltransferase [Pseudolabrys sp.]|jgi:CelD/BcsL family acetyltransferase involved in cellulose biosynthesis|nr:GNAT family N-acetyltransferase [Pseudolabrys sp.]
MTPAAQTTLDLSFSECRPPIGTSCTGADAPAALSCDDIRLEFHDDLLPLERPWRAFQAAADGTAFQTFEWLSTWQKHIGLREGARPAVVIGRGARGDMLFLLPFALGRRSFGRELTWLGSDLCDYNGPLLAPEYSRAVAPPQSVLLMRRVFESLRRDRRFAHDVVRLEKMTGAVGAQSNPLLALPITLHPSGAYRVTLGTDWETFYRDKRSSATRQRDRAKRKKLAQFGDVRIVHPVEDDDILATFDTLVAQKAASFARMGVGNIFARPGYLEFYRALATDPATRHLVHISRLQVGEESGAVNLGLVFRDRYYYVLASYADNEATRFGPGAAHLRDIMQYAIERGIGVFDFTVGDESYKLDWSEQDQLYDYIVGVTPVGSVAAAILRRKAALKRQIKQSPALWNVARKARELIGLFKRKS